MSNNKEEFKIVYKDCGTGRSKVSIVKRKSDGKLIIWKRARTYSPRIVGSYRKEIKKSKYWRKFGLSKVNVWWHPDRYSLLKTYIKGPTLSKVLKKNPELFSDKRNKYTKALIKFVKLLVDSKHYLHDLKGSNLVFDGKKWNIVDSGIIDNKKTRSAAAKEYRKYLLEKWSRGLNRENIRSLKSFLEKYCE